MYSKCLCKLYFIIYRCSYFIVTLQVFLDNRKPFWGGYIINFNELDNVIKNTHFLIWIIHFFQSSEVNNLINIHRKYTHRKCMYIENTCIVSEIFILHEMFIHYHWSLALMQLLHICHLTDMLYFYGKIEILKTLWIIWSITSVNQYIGTSKLIVRIANS